VQKIEGRSHCSDDAVWRDMQIPDCVHTKLDVMRRETYHFDKQI
jgi:hypothetical protein